MAVSSPVPGDVVLRESTNPKVRPLPSIPLPPNTTDLTNIADRLVADAIKRVSLTRRPSAIPKYPSNYFSSPTEESSSSSEEETSKRRKSKKPENV